MTGLRRVLGAGAAAVVLILCGCTAQPQDCARSSVQCVGLVTGFGSIEAGLAHEAWLGLQDAKAEGLIQRADFIETIDTRDRAANIRTFTDQGYDLVVTVGAGIAEETIAAAQDHPELHFVTLQPPSSAASTPENMVALMFHEEDSGFVAGAAAGMVTRTGHVAAICEAKFIDSVRRYCEGFRSGATYADPSAHVDVFFRSGPADLLFRDLDWGKATAERAVREGADVVFAVGEETAGAALEAAAARGALVIGAETDIYASQPDVRSQLVTSAILDARSSVLALIRLAVNGQFPKGVFWGSVGLAPYQTYENVLTTAEITKLEGILRELEQRTIDVGVPYDGP